MVATHLTTVVGMERTHLHLHTAGCAHIHHPEGTTVLVASILSSDHITVITHTHLLTEAVGITIVVLHTHAIFLRGCRLEEVITGTSTGTMVATTADQCTDKGHQLITEDLLLTAATTPQR